MTRSARTGSPRSTAASSAWWCSRIADWTIAGCSTSTSEGWSTSKIQPVSAWIMRLPAEAASVRWISMSAVGEGVGVVGAGGGLALDDLAQPLQGVLVGLVGGQPGERHLEQQPRVEQLVERDGAGLEHHRDRVAEAAAHALLGGAGDEDAAAPRLGGADQVAAGEQPQRLAQGGPADAELGGQVLLAAEEVAGPSPSRWM